MQSFRGQAIHIVVTFVQELRQAVHVGFDIGFDFDNIFILQRGGDSNPIDVNTPIEFECFDMHYGGQQGGEVGVLFVCVGAVCRSRSVETRATFS